MPVAEDRRPDLDLVADRALHGVAAAVAWGQTSSIWMRGGLFWGNDIAIPSAFRLGRASNRMQIRRYQRRAAARVLPPCRPPGPRAFRFVDWLAAAGAVVVWRSCRSGPPDRTGSPYMSSSHSPPGRVYFEKPGARVTTTSRGVRRAPALLGRPTGPRSPGAARSPTRCGFDGSGGGSGRTPPSGGVRLFGDVPIYVARKGADETAHPELFQHGEVAGRPADALSATGPVSGATRCTTGRAPPRGLPLVGSASPPHVRAARQTRIDHFRGFVAYWAVPEHNTTAKAGRWRTGPGAALSRRRRSASSARSTWSPRTSA